MKTLLLILTLIFQFSGNPRIETKYDRFSDTTSLILTQRIDPLSAVVDLGGGSYYVPPGASSLDVVRLHLIAVSKGRAVNRQAMVTLALTSRSTEWIYLKQTNSLRMILDGKERVDFGIMARTSSDIVPGGVVEQLAVSVPLTTIERLAKANKVEVQISNDEFELTKNQISDFRDFVARFSPTQ